MAPINAEINLSVAVRTSLQAQKWLLYHLSPSEHRAARRAAEQGASADEIKEAQKVRDQQDQTRKTAPLQIPDGAFVVDASDLTLSEVVDRVQAHVQSQLI